eukprot:11194477-Lingulodinium_polyedra.AAC.1
MEEDAPWQEARSKRRQKTLEKLQGPGAFRMQRMPEWECSGCGRRNYLSRPVCRCHDRREQCVLAADCFISEAG